MQILFKIALIFTLISTVLGAAIPHDQTSVSSSTSFSSSGSTDGSSPDLVQSDTATVAGVQSIETDKKERVQQALLDFFRYIPRGTGTCPFAAASGGKCGGSVLSQIPDGQVQSPSVLNQIPDGQVQSPSGTVNYGIPESFENFDSYAAYDEPSLGTAMISDEPTVNYGIPESFENFDSYAAYDEPTVNYYAPVVSSVVPVPVPETGLEVVSTNYTSNYTNENPSNYTNGHLEPEAPGYEGSAAATNTGIEPGVLVAIVVVCAMAVAL